MKKSFSSILITAVTIGFVAALTPQPARAFDLQNTFSSATAKLSQQFRKVYLSLPGDKSAEAVLEQTAQAMKDVSTVTYGVELEASLLESDNQLMNLKTMVSGPAAIEDIYQFDTINQDLSLSAELVMEGTTLSGDADIKLNGDVTYLKINQMPVVPFFEVGQIKDQWMVFTAPELEEDLAAVDTESLSEESSVYTDEQRAELEALEVEFIKSAKLSPAKKETIDGTKVFTIDMTFTADDLTTFIEKIAKVHGKSNEEITTELAEVDQALSQLEDITANIIVDRSNYYIKQATIPLVFTVTEEAKTQQVTSQLKAIGDFESADTLKVSITTTFSEYNQPVEFTVPADAVEASELLTSFGGTLPASLPEGSDAEEVTEFEAADLSTELDDLSAEEKEILKQYGVDINAL